MVYQDNIHKLVLHWSTVLTGLSYYKLCKLVSLLGAGCSYFFQHENKMFLQIPIYVLYVEDEPLF